MVTENEVENIANNRMKKSIDSLSRDFATVRTGRANTALVENLIVDYYGAPTPLSQLGSVIIREARVLQIQPWDKNSIQDIEKSILKTDLGLNPANDGTVIRIPIPHLSQERRETLAKLLKRKAEDGKIRIRNVRRDFLEKIRNLERAKNVSQDDSRRGQSKLQTITDDHIDRAEELSNAKESEILQL